MSSRVSTSRYDEAQHCRHDACTACAGRTACADVMSAAAAGASSVYHRGMTQPPALDTLQCWSYSWMLASQHGHACLVFCVVVVHCSPGVRAAATPPSLRRACWQTMATTQSTGEAGIFSSFSVSQCSLIAMLTGTPLGPAAARVALEALWGLQVVYIVNTCLLRQRLLPCFLRCCSVDTYGAGVDGSTAKEGCASRTFFMASNGLLCPR